MRIVCLFFQKLGKMSQNLLSAAVMIGALRVKDKQWQGTVLPLNWNGKQLQQGTWMHCNDKKMPSFRKYKFVKKKNK